MNEMGSILGLSIATGLCLIVIAVWRLRVRHIDAAEQEREREATAKAMQDGTLNKDGSKPCVVCGAPATEYMPMSGVSWMDKLPLLNRLFSLPPRYVICDDIAGDVKLCLTHKNFAVKKQEEFHAILRAERASFNASQEDKVARMEGGGLLRIIDEQYRVAARDLSTPVPQLAAHVATVHHAPEPMMTLVTSGPATVAGSDEDDVVPRHIGSA